MATQLRILVTLNLKLEIQVMAMDNHPVNGSMHCETQRVGKVYIKRGNPKKAIIKVVM